MKFELQQICCY